MIFYSSILSDQKYIKSMIKNYYFRKIYYFVLLKIVYQIKLYIIQITHKIMDFYLC